MLVNHEFDRLLKKEVMGLIEVCSWDLPGGGDWGHNRILIRAVSVLAKIWISHLKNASPEHYHFNQLAWLNSFSGNYKIIKLFWGRKPEMVKMIGTEGK